MLLKKGDRVVHCGAFHTEDAKIMRVTGIQKASFEVIEDELIDEIEWDDFRACLLYTSPSPRDVEESRMPSSA